MRKPIRFFLLKNRLKKTEEEEMKKEIKVQVTYSEGYKKRFTEACLKVIKKREQKESEK